MTFIAPMFALLSGQGIIEIVVWLFVYGVIFGMLWYAVEYFKIRDPFATAIKAILFLGALIICINALLSLIGKAFMPWHP